MSEFLPIHYAVLRDGRSWEPVRLSGLEAAPDGSLQLARVPAPAPGEEIDLPGPFLSEPSGLVIGRCGELFVADTAAHQVIRQDNTCHTRMLLPGHGGVGAGPGQFNYPRGLLIADGSLYVADSGNARVQQFRLPTFELRAIWAGVFGAPAALAEDKEGRIYALDRALKQIFRFNKWGALDDVYNAVLATALAGASPIFLAVGSDQKLYVSDGNRAAVRCFNEDGTESGDLPLPDPTGRFQAGALATDAERLYLADSQSGNIWTYDLTTRQSLGAIRGFRGPVAALAVDHEHALYVKTGDGERIDKFTFAKGCVAFGQLVSDRLDAGYMSGWFRAAVDAEATAGAKLRLQYFVTNNDAASAPKESDWIDGAALDLLLPKLAVTGMSELQPYRFLWLRVQISTSDGRANARLLQMQAETPGENYMDSLPGVYRRKDNGFLARWLALFRAELGDLELKLDEMARRFNAATVSEDELPWLASWLALNPPPGSVQSLRDLLGRALELYRRRGTCWGLPFWVELYGGVRPMIVESFRERRFWQLGQNSLLGFDTGLAPLTPNGMVLPDSAALCDLECASNHTAACTNERLMVGSTVVGESSPISANDLGEPLFSETAYRFHVLVPASQVRKPARHQELRGILDAERPAHTDYDLCLVEPRMRVGLQSSVGIDTYVAGAPPPMALAGSVLGLTSHLGEEPGERGASRVGRRDSLGTETILE